MQNCLRRSLEIFKPTAAHLRDECVNFAVISDTNPHYTASLCVRVMSKIDIQYVFADSNDKSLYLSWNHDTFVIELAKFQQKFGKNWLKKIPAEIWKKTG